MRGSEALKEKLTSISKQAGASLVPVPRPVRPKKEPEEIQDIRSIDMAKADRDKLARLLADRQSCSLQAKEATQKLDGIKAKKDGSGGKQGINEMIKELLAAWEVPSKFICGDLRVSRSEVPRMSTDRDKLIQEMTSAGLQPKVVNRIMEACTNITKSFQLRVSEVGKEQDDEDNALSR